MIPLDAIEKVRRHQDSFEGRGDALLERVALLADDVHESQVLIHFLGGYRTAEGASGETCHDRARASGRMLARRVPANVNPAKALRRWRGDLIEGTAHVDRLIAVVDAPFHRIGLDPGSVLAQRLDVFLAELAARVDERLRWALRRLGAVVAGRQAMVGA